MNKEKFIEKVGKSNIKNGTNGGCFGRIHSDGRGINYDLMAVRN